MEVIPISERLKIRHVGVLDLDEFYRWLHAWFEYEGYTVKETWYEERTLPNNSKYIEIRWTSTKDKTKYFTYMIGVQFLIPITTAVEVGDRKIKRQRGDFEIGLTAQIEKGKAYKEEKFEEESQIRVFLRKIYEKYIIRGRIEEYKDDIYDKFYKLHNEIVAFFNQYAQ